MREGERPSRGLGALKGPLTAAAWSSERLLEPAAEVQGPLVQEQGSALGPQGPGMCRRLGLPALGPLSGKESVQEAASPGTGQPLAACPGPSAVLGGRSWAGAAGTRGSGSPGKGQPGLARRLDLAVLEALGSAGGSSTALGAEGPPPPTPEQERALSPSPSWPPGSGGGERLASASCCGLILAVETGDLSSWTRTLPQPPVPEPSVPACQALPGWPSRDHLCGGLGSRSS